MTELEYRTWRVAPSEDPASQCVWVTVTEGDKVIARDALAARELIQQIADCAGSATDTTVVYSAGDHASLRLGLALAISLLSLPRLSDADRRLALSELAGCLRAMDEAG
jgi:hypothetical protein